MNGLDSNILCVTLSSIQTQQSNRQKKMNQIFTKQELQSHQMNVHKLTKSAKQEKTLMDLQEIEDSRKKRCSDRYDSSESSDR